MATNKGRGPNAVSCCYQMFSLSEQETGREKARCRYLGSMNDSSELVAVRLRERKAGERPVGFEPGFQIVPGLLEHMLQLFLPGHPWEQVRQAQNVEV